MEQQQLQQPLQQQPLQIQLEQQLQQQLQQTLQQQHCSNNCSNNSTDSLWFIFLYNMDDFSRHVKLIQADSGLLENHQGKSSDD